jgi:hypothetical protein
MKPTVCDLVTISWLHARRDGSAPVMLRLTEMVPDESNTPTNGCWQIGQEIHLTAEAAWRMVKSVTTALETVGFLPTDEDFEEYRTRILEDMDETAMEEAS